MFDIWADGVIRRLLVLNLLFHFRGHLEAKQILKSGLQEELTRGRGQRRKRPLQRYKWHKTDSQGPLKNDKLHQALAAVFAYRNATHASHHSSICLDSPCRPPWRVCCRQAVAKGAKLANGCDGVELNEVDSPSKSFLWKFQPPSLHRFDTITQTQPKESCGISPIAQLRCLGG